MLKNWVYIFPSVEFLFYVFYPEECQMISFNILKCLLFSNFYTSMFANILLFLMYIC